MAPAQPPGRRQRFGLVLIFITVSFMVEGTLSDSGWAQAQLELAKAGLSIDAEPKP